jgi:hypothetical protein
MRRLGKERSEIIPQCARQEPAGTGSPLLDWRCPSGTVPGTLDKRGSLNVVMRITLGKPWTVALAATLFIGSSALADAPTQYGVWTQKELSFQYTGFTTKYTCDGLTAKMRKLLLMLGARPSDLQVIGYGCTHAVAPDPLASVRIRMHVLEPAAAGAVAPAVPTRWETVDLLARRDPLDAALDCELIAQFDQQVLVLFATRSVDYSAQCAAHMPLVGGTRLKADVLVPDSASASTAPR